MSGFHQVQEIFYDAVALSDALTKIPDKCDCSNGRSHLSGECSCCRDAVAALRAGSRTGPGKQASCYQVLKKLRDSASRLIFDAAEGEKGWNDLSQNEQRSYFLIKNLAVDLESKIGRIEKEVEEFHLDCSHERLRRLKESGNELSRYLERLLSGTAEYPRTSARTGTTHHIPGETGGGDLTAPITEEVIIDLIQKHQMCYEYWREEAVVKGSRIKIGYDLRLCGLNEHVSGEHPIPGCPYCRRTYRDLHVVAEWILPMATDRTTQFRILPFDNSFHIGSKERNNRDEVVLTIQVLHKADVNEPIDECESRCLNDMIGKLKSLGMLEGRWKVDRHGPASTANK